MSAKESYCYRILEKHSVIVDFDGEPHLRNVPRVVEDETFKQWKMRVLGPDATNVVVYYPAEPAGQTRMRTLHVHDSVEHVKRMFREFGRTKDSKKQLAVEKAISDTEAELATFPRDTLVDLLDEYEQELEPSVQEFFQRFIDSKENNINTEDLLTSLINNYNTIARKYREGK